MTVSATTAISSTTDADESTAISVDDGAAITVRIDGVLQGDEYVKALYADDTPVVEKTNAGFAGVGIGYGGATSVRINGPITFKLAKSATVNAIAVSYYSS